jgi:hypothetical protein
MELAGVPEPIRRRNSVEPRPVLVVRRENADPYQKEKDNIMKIYAESLNFQINMEKKRDCVINNNTKLSSDQIRLMQLLFDLEKLNEKYELMDENSVRRVINPVIIARAYLRPRLYLPDCSKHIWLSELEKEVLEKEVLEKANLNMIK